MFFFSQNTHLFSFSSEFVAEGDAVELDALAEDGLFDEDQYLDIEEVDPDSIFDLEEDDEESSKQKKEDDKLTALIKAERKKDKEQEEREAEDREQNESSPAGQTTTTNSIIPVKSENQKQADQSATDPKKRAFDQFIKGDKGSSSPQQKNQQNAKQVPAKKGAAGETPVKKEKGAAGETPVKKEKTPQNGAAASSSSPLEPPQKKARIAGSASPANTQAAMAVLDDVEKQWFKYFQDREKVTRKQAEQELFHCSLKSSPKIINFLRLYVRIDSNKKLLSIKSQFQK